MSDTGVVNLCAQINKLFAQVEKAEYVKKAGQFVRGAAVMGAPAFSGHLRSNVFMDFKSNGSRATSSVYTNVSYAPYVELGTGPKGAADHDGISPEVTPVYRMSPWWIHESDIDLGVAETYRWPHIDTPDGRFYKCSGQPAQPFLYPAVKDNEREILDIMRSGLNEILERTGK